MLKKKKLEKALFPLVTHEGEGVFGGNVTANYFNGQRPTQA